MRGEVVRGWPEVPRVVARGAVGEELALRGRVEAAAVRIEVARGALGLAQLERDSRLAEPLRRGDRRQPRARGVVAGAARDLGVAAVEREAELRMRRGGERRRRPARHPVAGLARALVGARGELPRVIIGVAIRARRVRRADLGDLHRRAAGGRASRRRRRARRVARAAAHRGMLPLERIRARACCATVYVAGRKPSTVWHASHPTVRPAKRRAPRVRIAVAGGACAERRPHPLARESHVAFRARDRRVSPAQRIARRCRGRRPCRVDRQEARRHVALVARRRRARPLCGSA